jgi:hypothetical protein
MIRLRTLLALAATLLAAASLAGGAAARPFEEPHPNGQPTITGVPQENQTLTGHNGSWFCNPGPCVYTFQWQRNTGGVYLDIAGATNQDYVASADDVGFQLRVAVTATNYDCNALNQDCRYVSRTNWSAPTIPIAPDPFAPPHATAPPTVTGKAQEGETLTATQGSWRAGPDHFSYSWERCKGAACAAIGGATTSVYALVEGDVGSTVRVVVTASNVFGSGTSTSAPTAIVAAAPKVAPVPPSSVALPTIVGDPYEGGSVTALPGTWSGTPSLAYAYRWQRCDASGAACADIAGATAGTYAISPADSRRTLRVVVTASNTVGSAKASSPPSALVGPAGIVLLDSGSYSIPASSVTAPAQLVIDRIVVPTRLRSRAAFSVSVHVDDTRAYVVRDASAVVHGVKAGLVSRPAAARTADDGWVAFRLKPTKRLKLGRGRTLALAIEARTPDGAVVKHLVSIPLG